jgi:hypothetical protein
MASSSAPGSELAELKKKLKGLEEQKAVELKKEQGARDLVILSELNKDLDRVQGAITALSSGELHFPVSTSSSTLSGKMWHILAQSADFCTGCGTSGFSWFQLACSYFLAAAASISIASDS